MAKWWKKHLKLMKRAFQNSILKKNESIFEMQKEQTEAEVVWSKKWKGVAY